MSEEKQDEKKYRIQISLFEDKLEIRAFSQPKSVYSRKEIEKYLDMYENIMLGK